MSQSRVVLLGGGRSADAVQSWLISHGAEVERYASGDLPTGGMPWQDGMQRIGGMQRIDGWPVEATEAVVAVGLSLAQARAALLAWEPHLSVSTPMYVSALTHTVSEVAAGLRYPERVAGLQPWLFASLPLLELSRPVQAEDDSVWHGVTEFWSRYGKQVEVVDDAPGFVFPRILAMLVNEAAFATTEGVAAASAIDKAMRLGTNYPLGPLAWADEIGIDEVLGVLQALHQEFGDDRYRPAPLLRKYVYAGWTGKAAGRGFYKYGGGQNGGEKSEFGGSRTHD